MKGKPEVNLDVVTTRHGPIITEIIPGEKRQLALKWVIYDPSVSSTVFFDVDSAKNWQEFRAAFSHFGAPGQNVVYADVDGHIGYQATGAIPIRAAGDGSVPVPGDDDSHEMDGIRSVRAASQRVRPAFGHHCNRQWAHHAGRVSLRAEH